MIEVEIRAKINNFGEIKNKFKKLDIEFVKKEKQIDRIFGNPKFLDSNNMIIEGGLVARIRTVDNKNVLEFKEISRDKGGIEIRSELGNLGAGLELLEKLQFNEAFTVSKSREVYHYKDFEICLDEVEKLGLFVEIEKTVSSPDQKESARKECADLLEKISPSSEIESRKYGDMMQELINKNDN